MAVIQFDFSIVQLYVDALDNVFRSEHRHLVVDHIYCGEGSKAGPDEACFFTFGQDMSGTWKKFRTDSEKILKAKNRL